MGVARVNSARLRRALGEGDLDIFMYNRICMCMYVV